MKIIFFEFGVTVQTVPSMKQQKHLVNFTVNIVIPAFSGTPSGSTATHLMLNC